MCLDGSSRIGRPSYSTVDINEAIKCRQRQITLLFQRPLYVEGAEVSGPLVLALL